MIHPGGDFDYVPDPGYVGQDSFTYQLQADLDAYSEILTAATVFIDVSGADGTTTTTTVPDTTTAHTTTVADTTTTTAADATTTTTPRHDGGHPRLHDPRVGHDAARHRPRNVDSRPGAVGAVAASSRRFPCRHVQRLPEPVGRG